MVSSGMAIFLNLSTVDPVQIQLMPDKPSEIDIALPNYMPIQGMLSSIGGPA